MLIKEYHILLPMSLEEYQVAQLYMIQKKSREESSGEGSGVEILANRPYSDGPGGSGQYTHKIYHVGSHIPSWFRALLPKAALQVEEESWNAYPYTRTRYTCPFVEKFSIEIETYYRPDAGQQTNVFNLSAAEKRQRILDTIDIVRDPISPGEYKPEEDPKLYHSAKTGRGPLGDDWLEAAAGGPLMCAYKLCKVEFRYWGMQSKIEQFIHDVGLRKVMLRAHRQAWCWQDEWTDLTMEDIRQLEEETARMLAQKMAKCGEAEEPPTAGPSPEGRPEPGGASGQEGAEVQGVADASPDDTFAKQWSTSSRSSYSSQHGGGVSPQSLSEWRMQNIARDSENSSEEEFFDAHEDLSDSDEVFAKEMTKWSSNDFLDTLERPAELDEGTQPAPPRWMAKDWGCLASLRAARRRVRRRRAGSTPFSSSSTVATSWTRERASRAPSRRTCRRWRPPLMLSPASTSPRRWDTWHCAWCPARPSAPLPTPSSLSSAPTATTGTACPAARTTSRWQPSRCWPPPRGATSTPWVPSLPVPTRHTVPSCTPGRGPASAGRARSPSPPSCAAAGTRWPTGRMGRRGRARPAPSWGRSRPAGSRGTATITAPRAACRLARPRWRQRHRGAAPQQRTGRRVPAPASTLSGPAASRLRADLQPLPRRRPLRLSPGASPGQGLPRRPAAQRAPLPEVPPGRRHLLPAGGGPPDALCPVPARGGCHPPYPHRQLRGLLEGQRAGGAPHSRQHQRSRQNPGALVGSEAHRLLAVLPRRPDRLPHHHPAPPLPRQLLGVLRCGGLHPAPGDGEGGAAASRERGELYLQPRYPPGEVAAQAHPSEDPECDGQPPGQRCDRLRGQSAGPQRALHVRTPRRGDADRGEGGHLHHDAAALREVAVLRHRGDERQWAPDLHHPSGQGSGHWHLPRAHGRQGGPQLRRGVPDGGGPGHRVGRVQHRWLLHRQRLHHGQRPQSEGGGCRRRTALAGLGLHDHLRDGASRHAEAPCGGLALPAQLPPRRRLLLRRAHPRPPAPESRLPPEPAHRGGDHHRRRLRLHQGRLRLQLAGARADTHLHRGPGHQEVPQPVPVPVRGLRSPPGPAGGSGAGPLPQGTPAARAGQRHLRLPGAR
ncbi:membrane-associated phosphatidylinositol transfer protein 1 isoform X3 [Ciconia boyciana]|uniref:membrane-associated phosphatidylinositol transfer protein 1 isoform X3 n=1 Tax=Ciconia boyciana TaxID=52775 RepID=UPI003BA395B4